MGEQEPKKVAKHICAGLLAHVDAGKTTLSEAMLYLSGAKRTLGRVDHRDACLDTHAIERERGITVFSKQARLETDHFRMTLVDTPGHMDFSPEAERVMGILDCAVMVISGTDGVQAHTLTLWNLLRRYQVPVFLFINKMDLPGKTREEILAQLPAGCVDFTAPREVLEEQAAMTDEALLESYLETGHVTDGNLRGLITDRKIFPCCFGSALKLTGVDTLLSLLDTYAPRRDHPADFGARIYKISRDAAGNRLTWLKVTGGSLRVRMPLTYSVEGDRILEEKVQQLRLYTADKFQAVEEVEAGMVCAVTGLTRTRIGQGLGWEPPMGETVMEPVMTYRVNLPKGVDPAVALPKLRQLEEEEPQLHLVWEEPLRQIHVQIMGRVQLQVFQELVRQRFALEVTLDNGRIFYKETIAAPVEGVGHYEPLRHYAETHLILEPLPRGSGLVFASRCAPDTLDINYQHLILTHLGEKTHRGVLTGAPITDMKITLAAGRAHLKHTEGGDFRQATYRAVRQGLMEARSILLEPWYDFVLTLPTETVGRAISDIRAMSGQFGAPETLGQMSRLRGQLPASELGDYGDQVAAYTQGRGQLQISLRGYDVCHNAQTVIAETAYDPQADLDNTPDSVFCAHGAGFPVKWDQVKAHMHLESCLKTEKPQVIPRNLRLDDKELEAIMEREFGPIRRPQYQSPRKAAPQPEVSVRPPREQYFLVDGYNMIFAWESLAALAKKDLDAARRGLLDRLSSFAGFRKCRVVVVFDGYKVPGNPGEKGHFHNIQVVYTKENQTADAYLEALVAQIGPNYNLRVATSDALIQLSSLRSGALRMSARELEEEVVRSEGEMRRHY